MSDLDLDPAEGAAPVIDDHTSVQGWTPINGRVVATNIHGVRFYKPVQLPEYPTSVWEQLSERDPDEDEILSYDEDEEITLPSDVKASEASALSQFIGPSIRSNDSRYQDMSEEEIFDGDPADFEGSLLFWLASRYSLKRLTEKINQYRSSPVISEGILRRRLYEKYIPTVAEREGKTVEEVRKELDDAREANGVGRKKRKSSDSNLKSSESQQQDVNEHDRVPLAEAASHSRNLLDADALPSHKTLAMRIMPWLKDQASDSSGSKSPAKKKKSAVGLKPLTIPDEKSKNTTTTPSTATPNTGDLGPIPVTDQNIFDGEPSTIVGPVIYNLAIRYSIAEIHKRVILVHPSSDLTQNQVKDRLYKYVGTMEKETGKDRETILRELNEARQAQRTNRKGLKGGFQRKRKAKDVEDDIIDMPKHDGDVETAEALQAIDAEIKRSKPKAKKCKTEEKLKPYVSTLGAERQNVTALPKSPTATPGDGTPKRRSNVVIPVFTPSSVKTTVETSPYFAKTAAPPQPRFQPDTQVNDLVEQITDYIEQDSSPKLADTARSYGAALALDSPATPREIERVVQESSPLQEISPISTRTLSE